MRVEPLSEAEQSGLVRDRCPRTLRPRCAAISPIGSRLRCGACSQAAAEEARARTAGARRSARQHAQGRPREGAEGAWPGTRPCRRCLPSASACRRLKGRAGSPTWRLKLAHGKGWYEVQDEGSQIAALMAGAAPRQQVLDICAGAGGKTLAFAAAMQNTGQVYAFDDDAARLRPIFERLKRAGARNVQVMRAGDATGTGRARPPLRCRILSMRPAQARGAWRRRPDAKWRLKPAKLAQRQDEQRAILALAAPLVKPGGRLVYVTCSVLPEENEDQIAWFLANHSDFAALPWRDAWNAAIASEPPRRQTRAIRGCCSRLPGTARTGSSSPCWRKNLSVASARRAAGQLAEDVRRPQISL